MCNWCKRMRPTPRTLCIVLVILLPLAMGELGAARAERPEGDGGQVVQSASRYAILAWNDLGMHCYNPSYQDLAVLPPFNTLWAQVVRVGNPPQIITQGVTVSYSFPDNTYSVGKTNFWTYAQALYGVALPPNIGLSGKGLSGAMDQRGDHFVAEGIPLTEYSDSAPTVRQPYQLAVLVATENGTGRELARLTVVAPVSTEMRCDTCHYDGGVEDIRTGRVDTNILALHDRENADKYPSGHAGNLMDRRPINCAECHADNAVGAPGVAGIPNLSQAMHDKHAEEGNIPPTTEGCYLCHPGPETRCLRDVMSQKGMTCLSCHGNMQAVSQNPNPWLQEPRCDSASCHGAKYAQNQPLYRQSLGHGGLYCEACHDSTHAIARSREPNDAIKFIQLQGHSGTLDECIVCHASVPAGAGPHGTSPRQYFHLPILTRR
jgi:hypothetical protein